MTYKTFKKLSVLSKSIRTHNTHRNTFIGRRHAKSKGKAIGQVLRHSSIKVNFDPLEISKPSY